MESAQPTIDDVMQVRIDVLVWVRGSSVCWVLLGTVVWVLLNTADITMNRFRVVDPLAVSCFDLCLVCTVMTTRFVFGPWTEIVR